MKFKTRKSRRLIIIKLLMKGQALKLLKSVPNHLRKKRSKKEKVIVKRRVLSRI